MAGYIPKEQLTAYQRWEVAAFDEAEREAAAAAASEAAAAEAAAAAPPEEPEPPPVVFPTVEEIERIHTDAHEAGFSAGQAEGHAQGHAEGFASGLAEAKEEAERIRAVLVNLGDSLQNIDQSVAEQVLALSLEVASQVMRQTLRLKPELLLPVVREALAALPPQLGHTALFINPADAALIRSQLGEQLAHNNWRIIEDGSIDRGGCRVEAGACQVDATLPTRWRRVVESMGISEDWLDAHP